MLICALTFYQLATMCKPDTACSAQVPLSTSNGQTKLAHLFPTASISVTCYSACFAGNPSQTGSLCSLLATMWPPSSLPATLPPPQMGSWYLFRGYPDFPCTVGSSESALVDETQSLALQCHGDGS